MASSEREILESIDTRLGGILVLLLDLYLRDTGLAKPKPRSVDRMLADVGLTSVEIAALLGKSERAVQLQVAAGPKPAKQKSSPRAKK